MLCRTIDIYTHIFSYNKNWVHCLPSRYKLKVLLETFKYILDLSDKLCQDKHL